MGPARQLGLFGDDPSPKKRARRGEAPPVGPAPVSAEVRRLAEQIPTPLRFGTSSWSFPGWEGLVYDRRATTRELAQKGLAAYAQHPLLNTVGVDRTYYAPVAADVFRGYAEAVPPEFRFLVKAHEACTLRRFSDHPRYGTNRGKDNDLFLSAAYATEFVVGPMREGLGEKAGPLVFQFPPQSVAGVGGAAGFADRLHGFLAELPSGVLYAVEIRNRQLLSDRYREALVAANVCHCLTVHPQMPSVAAQARAAVDEAAPATVVRWMLGDLTYEAAKKRFEPFDALVEEDPLSRGDIADVAAEAHAVRRPAYFVVNNKAEGSSPLSVVALAHEVAERLGNPEF